MIASAPRRSRSPCQMSSASATLRAASTASKSSHEPGNWRTPNFTSCSGAAQQLDLVVLDEGVREQLLAHRLELRGVLDVELDESPDVDVGGAVEAEGRQRPLDGDALRVEDARLGADQNACPHCPDPAAPAR